MHPMFKQLFPGTEDLAAKATGGAACTGPGKPRRP